MEILKELLKENEAIYEVTCCASKSTYIIGPVVEDINRDIDLSGCIEETLHRMLENGCLDSDIFCVLSATKEDTKQEQHESDYNIDLGYVICDFYPTGIVETGICYEQPMIAYTVHYWDTVLCKNFTVEEDATDEELLQAMGDKFGFNTEEYIVNDVRDDGTLIGVQDVLDDTLLFVLKRKFEATAKDIAA